MLSVIFSVSLCFVSLYWMLWHLWQCLLFNWKGLEISVYRWTVTTTLAYCTTTLISMLQKASAFSIGREKHIALIAILPLLALAKIVHRNTTAMKVLTNIFESRSQSNKHFFIKSTHLCLQVRPFWATKKCFVHYWNGLAYKRRVNLHQKKYYWIVWRTHKLFSIKLEEK
jgi:hypothetical protein